MISILSFIFAAAVNQACLVRQVLVEAENQSLSGRATVSEVIEERSRRSGLGECDVIAAPRQFGDRRLDPSLKSIGQAMIATRWPAACAAVHFDVKSSRHGWARNLPVACIVGAHVFYEDSKWRG